MRPAGFKMPSRCLTAYLANSRRIFSHPTRQITGGVHDRHAKRSRGRNEEGFEKAGSLAPV